MLSVICGEAFGELRELPSESVHCCVTSPPYWGLRDYSVCGCSVQRLVHPPGTIFGSAQGQAPVGRKEPNSECPNCNGSGKSQSVSDAQLGLEKTPEEYVLKMVEIFREVRRVLRKDGTLWLNLGDSYAGNKEGNTNGLYGKVKQKSGVNDNAQKRSVPQGLKAKDLYGIPWRVALALQADGWYLRSDIIWAKPNPMPESVTDRPTKSHEYLFLLTKSARYFYDAEAIKEPHTQLDFVKQVENQRAKEAARGENRLPSHMDSPATGVQRFGSTTADRYLNPNGRNKRSVWTVATDPYPEVHFATYPPDLIKPCILAGTSAKGCCARCGAPWERIVSERKLESEDSELDRYGTGKAGVHRKLGQAYQRQMDDEPIKTLGWQPTCGCLAYHEHKYFAPIPCTVLDPFAGSGTTGAVALELGRKAILIELNPKYVELIKDRCNITPGLQLA